MSGWAGQMRAFENQQKANNEAAEAAAKKRFNNNKRKAKANHNRALGVNSSVRNKLRRLHNTGHKNHYYAKRMNQLNRGNREGVLNKLTRHRARKNYTSTSARSARGELLNNTITQLRREMDQHTGGSKVRGRRVLKNGAHAGYVKQKDGTWKWSFLSKKRN
jgi:hypothetical protein